MPPVAGALQRRYPAELVPGGNGVARGGDGRIYSFCGSTSAAYTPATNTWTAFRHDPISRRAFAVAAGKNGAILVVGGCCDGTGSALNAAEFYSPHTNTWSAVAPMPTPRMSLALSYASGKFYALGGSDSVGNVTDEVDSFNPSTNRWSGCRPFARDGSVRARGGDGP